MKKLIFLLLLLLPISLFGQRQFHAGIEIKEYIWGLNDANTFVRFNDPGDMISFNAGGVGFLIMIEGSTDYMSFNNNKVDADLRIWGDNNLLLSTDGANDRVGLGTLTPSGLFTVDGNKTTINLFEVINDHDGIIGDSSAYVDKLGRGYFSNIRAVDDVTFITSIGSQSSTNNSGIRTTAIGYQALRNNSGDQVTGLGVFAAEANSGNQVNGFGYNAAADNTADYANGFGHSAIKDNTGLRANGFGYTALQFNSGDFCDGFGYGALGYNEGSYSGGIGLSALAYNKSTSVWGVGHSVLRLNAGAYVSGFGRSAGEYNVGEQNSAFGSYAFNTFTEDGGSAQTFASTDIIVDGDTIFISAHGFSGTHINLKWTATTGTLPAGILLNQVDQFEIVHVDTIALLTDNMTDQGSGNHTLTPQVVYTNSTGLGFNAEPSASNQIQLGDLNITEVKSTGSFNTTGSFQIGGTDAIDSGGFFRPITSADGDAPNNSIYYSTTQTKLVYKDSSGGIHYLY